MFTANKILVSLVFAIFAMAQVALAQVAPAGLSIDTDYKIGEAGYYYVNMPNSGSKTVPLEKGDVVFKIYDDGGKNGPFAGNRGEERSVLVRAPEGYIFEVTGRIVSLNFENSFNIYDGEDAGLASKIYCYNCGNVVQREVENIGAYKTTGNALLVSHNPSLEPYAGFELTVRVKPNAHAHNITIDQKSGGTWTANTGRIGIVKHDVDLVFAPEANRILTSVKVVKTGRASTEVPLTKVENNHFRFTMPDYDVTVIPGAYEWEWTSGNTICHLDNKGTFTVRAIDGTDGAMADYEHGRYVPWIDQMESIKSVVVESGVTVVGATTFQNGRYIASVSLPEGLQSIHDDVFKFCKRLTSITIPFSVRSVSAGAFYGCDGLLNVYSLAPGKEINWGKNKSDFIVGDGGVGGPYTKMHVYPSQLKAYQEKGLNVIYRGDLETSGNWLDNGNYATSFSQQNGNTITITNEAEMARLAYMVNVEHKHYNGYTFKLARDLNMHKYYWTPIGTGPINSSAGWTPFAGTFDGQGHTINGIVVNRSGSKYNGLFGFVGAMEYTVAKGEVKNVSLKQSSITGGDYTAGLVGYLRYGKVDNCATDADVNGKKYVGGLVGTMEGHQNNGIYASVTKSLYLGNKVTGTQNVRAVVGSCASNKELCIIKSYYTDRNLSAKTSQDVYAAKFSNENSEGIAVTFDGEGKVSFGDDTYGATNGSASFTVRATDPYKKIASIKVNDNEIATKTGTFSFGLCSNADVCRVNATLSDAQLAGSGTEDDPYQISSVDDWNLFAELVAGGATFNGKFVKQMDQIGSQGRNSYEGITAMVGESEKFSFQGTYDGSKYYLLGSINSTADYAAPFRYVKNATIKNVKVAGTFNVGKHGSALVGRTYGTTHIDSVWVAMATSINSSRSEDRYMGGVVGHGGNSTLSMKNVLFEANMTNDDDYTGGLLGWTDGMTLYLDSCTFRGNFSGNGAFHPIAVKDWYKPLQATVNHVYFYTGPVNIDNGHIAVEAIRVQTKVPTDGKYAKAVDALSEGKSTCYYYNDAPQGLKIDYDKERGTPGYYYINMRCEDRGQRLELGSDVTSFTVYDDGGKLGKECGFYGYSRGSKMTLVAPKNKVFEVQGQIEGMDPSGDHLSINDNAGHELFKYGMYHGDKSEWADIPKATTAGNELYIETKNDNDGEMLDEMGIVFPGFEVHLTVKDDGKIRFGAITVESDYSKAVIDGSYKEKDAVNIPSDITVQSVTLDRTFVPGKFSTIMLPFSIAVNKVPKAKFYEFAQMDYDQKTDRWIVGVSEIKSSDVLKANTPYLVVTDGKTLTFDGKVTLNTTTGGKGEMVRGDWAFRGTYNYFVFGDSAEILGNAYGFVAKDTIVDGKQFSAGQFVKAGSKAYILPMRAYLVHNGANSSQKNAGGFGEFGTLPETVDLKIMDTQGNVAEKASLNTRTGEIKRGRWYDLHGRKLNGKPADNGKYLHNGRVEVVR